MKNVSVRRITVTAIMSAASFVLMLLEFATPLTPEFLKFDFSDFPALLTAFSLGPVYGVLVQLVKNLLHLPFTMTAGIGELANFIVGSALALPAGLVYRLKKTRTGAMLGSLSGSVFAALVSFPVNYFITYPFYTGFMPMDAIISMYSVLIPAANTLPKALVIVNMPFTFVKGMVSVLLTFLVYKKLSPILKGSSVKNKNRG